MIVERMLRAVPGTEKSANLGRGLEQIRQALTRLIRSSCFRLSSWSLSLCPTPERDRGLADVRIKSGGFCDRKPDRMDLRPNEKAPPVAEGLVLILDDTVS
jgi:hypothetical protein